MFINLVAIELDKSTSYEVLCCQYNAEIQGDRHETGYARQCVLA
mgnify:CR=1 FL=1